MGQDAAAHHHSLRGVDLIKICHSLHVVTGIPWNEPALLRFDVTGPATLYLAKGIEAEWTLDGRRDGGTTNTAIAKDGSR